MRQTLLGSPFSITFLSIVAIMMVKCNFSACRHYTIAVRARFPNRIPVCSNTGHVFRSIHKSDCRNSLGGCTSIPDKHALAAIQSSVPSTYGSDRPNLLPITSCTAPDKTLPFFGLLTSYCRLYSVSVWWAWSQSVCRHEIILIMICRISSFSRWT